MSPRVILFASSIAFNGAGLIALLFKPTLAPPAIRDVFRLHMAQPAKTSAVSAKSVAVKPAERKKLWPALDTGGDLRALSARLRAAGFPAEIVRAIILAELSARYDARLRSFYEPDATTPFWKARPFGYFGDGEKRMAEYQQLQRERAKIQRELLSDPFFSSDDITSAQRRQYGNLPRQKIDLIQRIEDDYAEMNSAVRAATNGILLAEDKEKLALLARERRADLGSVLTADELADYDFRSSPITSILSRQLGAFNPTETEFRALFKAEQAYSDRLAPSGGLAGGNFDERMSAQEKLNADIRAALGPARFGDYARETDSVYQQLLRLGEREHIPRETLLQAYNVRDNVAVESGRIADDASLPVDQKRAALQALAERTRNQLLGILGPTAGPTYVQVVDARWLNSVQRGAAVTFAGGPGGGMMMMGSTGTSGMPIVVSVGVAPSFRSVAAPPRPPVAPPTP